MSPDALRYAMSAPGGYRRARGPVHAGWYAAATTAFNTGDVDTLMRLFASDVVQHVPGDGPMAGTYKGPEAVLGYYGKLSEMTDGTFRAHLVDVHGDGLGHVTAVHQTVAERNGVKRMQPRLDPVQLRRGQGSRPARAARRPARGRRVPELTAPDRPSRRTVAESTPPQDRSRTRLAG